MPLSYDKDGGGAAALKRYAAQLRDVSRQAGFGEPAAELQAKLAEAAAGETAQRGGGLKAGGLKAKLLGGQAAACGSGLWVAGRHSRQPARPCS